MESPQEISPKSSDLDSDSESSSAPEKKSKSQVISVKKKKPRFATTRGLGTSSLGASLKHITPSNSPTAFQPSFGSTPE